LSLYFKRHRQAYYDHLTRVRTHGDWEGWLAFFLEGVKETSAQAVQAARRILTLMEGDRERIEGLGRSAASVLRLHLYSQTHPIFSIAVASKATGISFPTAATAVENLQGLGVLREITGRQRDRVFAHGAYLDILNEGTEPLKP
jgi:Fic family protein